MGAGRRYRIDSSSRGNEEAKIYLDEGVPNSLINLRGIVKSLLARNDGQANVGRGFAECCVDEMSPEFVNFAPNRGTGQDLSNYVKNYAALRPMRSLVISVKICRMINVNTQSSQLTYKLSGKGRGPRARPIPTPLARATEGRCSWLALYFASRLKIDCNSPRANRDGRSHMLQ
jgi:hypothetical protein